MKAFRLFLSAAVLAGLALPISPVLEQCAMAQTLAEAPCDMPCCDHHEDKKPSPCPTLTQLPERILNSGTSLDKPSLSPIPVQACGVPDPADAVENRLSDSASPSCPRPCCNGSPDTRAPPHS